MRQESFGFEQLEVWQKAVEFARCIYAITRAFPKAELFGLTTQLRRASVSVAANIAEGASRSSGKDQARFFEISYGSLNEIATLLHIAGQEAYIADDQMKPLREDIQVMCRMLSGLKRASEQRISGR